MNLFIQMGKSLYSPKDIARYRFQGIGKTILYVFLLILISVLPSAYYTSIGLNEAVTATKETLKTDIPSFKIANGELKAETKEPMFFTKEGFTIIFDPTGAVDHTDLEARDATFAMLKNEAVLSAGGESNSIPYTLFDKEVLTKADVTKLIDSADSSLPIFIGLLFLAIYIFSSGIKFIEISLLALFGLLLKKLAGKNLHYKHLWRIAAYSVTLPTIFFTIMSLLKTVVPYSVMINWFVGSMMILLVIKEIPNQKTRVEK